MSRPAGIAADEPAMVTVDRFLDPAQAQMAKGLLESAGIECFLQGEHANNLVPLAFRVRLQVMQKDEQEARSILRSVQEDDQGPPGQPS